MASRYDTIIANVQSMINQNAPVHDINGYLSTEGITPAQLRKLVEGPTIGGQVKEFFKGLPTGFFNILESAGVGASALLPEDAEKAVRGFIRERADALRKPFAPAMGYEDTIGSKFGQAVGSVGPFIASGPLGWAGRTALGMAAGAGEARTAAEAKGASESERALATALGAPVGVFDLFIREFQIGKSIVTRALASGGIEGATEAAQKIAQNMIAKGVYDPSQPILAGSGEEGAYGAGAGALVRFLLDAAVGRKGGGGRGGMPGESPDVEAAAPGVPLLPAPTTTRAGLPDSYAEATQEVERLKRMEPSEEVLARIEQLEAYKERLIADDLEAGNRQPFEEPGSLEDQIRNQSVTQGEFREMMDLPTAEMTVEGQAAPDVQAALDQRMEVERELAARAAGSLPQPVRVGNNLLYTDKELQDTYDALTSQATANLEAEGVVPATVLTADLLDATGLPKQSGLYKQLLGKDLTDLADLDAVNQIVERAQGNTRLSKDTKAALETIANSAANLYSEQGELFGPRGGVVEQQKGRPTPTQKKIAKVTEGKDLSDPVQAAQVRRELTDYANNPSRSPKAIQEVSEFLDNLPSAQPEATNVLKSDEPIGAAVEPSSEVVDQRGEVPAGGTEASVPGGVDATGDLFGQPATGEGVQPAALEEGTYGQPDAESAATVDTGVPAVETVGEPAPDVSATAAPEVEAQAAPKTVEGRVDLRDAINRLVFEGGARRADAVEEVNQLSDSFGGVSEADLQEAIQRAKAKRPKYRTAEEEGEGMPRSTVQKIVDSIVSRWKNAPNITVIQDIQELPQRLFQQLVKDDAWNAQGLYDAQTKTVFIIADNVYSAKDVVTTVAHETLGHFGMQSILGNTYSKVMEDIYNGNAKVREAAKARMERYGEGKHLAVEEVLARMAEQGVYNNAIQRIFNAIRQFFRRIGFNPALVTDNEIRALLANARRFVIEGGTMREGAPVFRDKAVYRRKEEELTPEGKEAAALNERMKNIANEPEPDIDMTFRQRLGLKMDMFKDFGKKFRQAVVDKDAPVKDQLNAKFQNKLRDNLEGIIGYIYNEQAQEAAGFADQLMRRGGIRKTKDGLFEINDRKVNGEQVSLDRVFEIIIENLGKRLGSSKTAVTLAHRAFIAQRANELNKRNEVLRQQAEAAEAKGNTAAAKKLRAQIIAVRASKEEIAAGLEAMQKYPELQKAFDTFTKYNDGIIDFLVDSGYLSPAAAQEWKNNIGYVPWTRIEEEDSKLMQMGKLRTGNVHLSGLPQLDKEGSSKEIRNVLDNMVGHTIWAVRAGLKNRAAIKTLEQMPDAIELKTQEEVDRALANKATRHLVVFAYRDGERVAFKLQNEVDLPAFSNVVDAANPMLGIAKAAATGLRSFVTHMPTFALSQLSQDTVRAMFLSGVRHPFSLPSKVMKHFVRSVMGGASDIQALGITGAYDGMPEHAMQRARERHGLQERAIWRRAWDKLEHFSLSADMAVRAAIYEQTMQETGDQVLAFHRAKEYINFKTVGNDSSIRILRQIIPFMNAYIQGMDVLYRTLKGKGLSGADRKEALALFFTTGMKVAALSMIYAALVGDDDDYKGLDDYERDKNFIIPGTGLKIPVAPEIGFMFKSIPERLMMAMAREGTDRPVDSTTFMRGMRDAFITAYGGVNLTPQIVKPAIEVATNYSFFTGNPIVGINMAGKETSEQFNDRTSELAKLFGYIGISPMKVDHLLRGYLGTVGGVALDLTDAVADPNRMNKPINKLPLIKTFMYDDTGRGYKTEFYAFREDVDRVVNTVNAFKRDGRADELEKYLTEDRLKLYAMRGVVNNVEERLGDLRKYRNIISNDPDLSPEEKREKVDEILKMERDFLVAYNIPRLKVMAGM